MKKDRSYSYKKLLEQNLKNLSQKRVDVYFLKSEAMKEAMQDRKEEIEEKKQEKEERY